MRARGNVWWAAVVVMALATLVGCGSSEATRNAPLAERGVMDLRAWDFRGGPARLDGEWTFYPDRLLTPEEIASGSHAAQRVFVPRTWNQQKPPYVRHDEFGTGTYRLVVRIPEEEVGRSKGLSTYKVLTAYKLWIDGELVAAEGRVGASAEAMVPAARPRTFFFTPADGDVELVLQASNFSHRNGGIWKSMYFGDDAAVVDRLELQHSIDLLLISGLLLIGVYHMWHFVVRPKDRASLYFGLFSLALGLRACTVGEAFLLKLIPAFPYLWLSKLEFLGTYLAAPFALLYARRMFPAELRNAATLAFLAANFAFVATVVATPEAVYTRSYYPFQWVVYAELLYLIGAVVKAAFVRRPGANTTLFALIVFTGAVVHDFLFYNQQIQSRDLAPLGLLVFFLTQSFHLMGQYSRTLSSVESLSRELVELNRTLESKVEERTHALQASQQQLEEANRRLHRMSYYDALMEIPNRRYFEDMLDKEWRQAARSGLPISLVMIDIDSFKLYNDNYGHRAGDAVLYAVGQALQKALHRPRDLVARYGGEEIALILPETDAEGAGRVAELLRERVYALRLPHRFSEFEVVTVSLGAATCVPNETATKELLVQAADGALYEAKRGGRNRVCAAEL